MHTFKKFALVTILSGAAVAPALAHAANNEDSYKPSTTTATAPVAAEATTPKMTITKNAAKTETFSQMDKDHSGKLNLSEYETGIKGSHKEAKQKFAALDKNHDRKLTPEEAGTISTQ